MQLYDCMYMYVRIYVCVYIYIYIYIYAYFWSFELPRGIGAPAAGAAGRQPARAPAAVMLLRGT